MGTAAGPGTGFLEPTFKRSARIWWAWVWRSAVFGGAAGLFGSLVLSLSGILDRVSEKTGQYLGVGYWRSARDSRGHLGLSDGPGKGIWRISHSSGAQGSDCSACLQR